MIPAKPKKISLVQTLAPYIKGGAKNEAAKKVIEMERKMELGRERLKKAIKASNERSREVEKKVQKIRNSFK